MVWERDRILTYLALETWQGRLEKGEEESLLASNLCLDEYETRHGSADLGSYPEQEYDIPVAVAVVDKYGRAIVDVQAKPTKAFRLCLVSKHQRGTISALNEEVKFGEGFEQILSKAGVSARQTQPATMQSPPAKTAGDSHSVRNPRYGGKSHRCRRAKPLLPWDGTEQQWNSP